MLQHIITIETRLSWKEFSQLHKIFVDIPGLNACFIHNTEYSIFKPKRHISLTLPSIELILMSSFYISLEIPLCKSICVPWLIPTTYFLSNLFVITIVLLEMIKHTDWSVTSCDYKSLLRYFIFIIFLHYLPWYPSEYPLRILFGHRPLSPLLALIPPGEFPWS